MHSVVKVSRLLPIMHEIEEIRVGSYAGALLQEFSKLFHLVAAGMHLSVDLEVCYGIQYCKRPHKRIGHKSLLKQYCQLLCRTIATSVR